MTKDTQRLFWLLGGAIVIGIVYFAAMYTPSASTDMATTTADMASTTASSTASTTATKTATKAATSRTTTAVSSSAQPAAPAMTFTWSYAGHGMGTNQLSADVTLVADGKEHALGEFIGTCKSINTEDLQGAGEVSGTLCLDGEKGTEIGVFRSGSKYLVQKGDIVLGDAKTPGKRGPFVTILTLP